MKRSLERFSVVIDANEHHHGNTWDFPGYSVSVSPLLKFGCDYAVRGQLGQIGVERKSFSDYIRCIGHDWTRFLKQLEKLQRNRIHAVIVEGNIDDPIHQYTSMVHDAIITQTGKVTALGVPVLFAGTRLKARDLCLSFMKAALQRIQDGT